MTIKVKAAPGLRVPTEENSRKYITDADTVLVPANVYHLRRIADGDLIRVTGKETTKPAAKASEKTDKGV